VIDAPISSGPSFAWAARKDFVCPSEVPLDLCMMKAEASVRVVCHSSLIPPVFSSTARAEAEYPSCGLSRVLARPRFWGFDVSPHLLKPVSDFYSDTYFKETGLSESSLWKSFFYMGDDGSLKEKMGSPKGQ
jgi:hypothetical protein